MKNNYETSDNINRLIYLLVLIALASVAVKAQTVEHRTGKGGGGWNNSAYFEKAPKVKLLNWSDLPETWDGKQYTMWGVDLLAGVMWGMRERFHADRTVYERKWGVGSESWLGSEQWKRNYVDNDPEKPHKTEIIGNFGRDMWHTFGYASGGIVAATSFTIGARKQPLKFRLLNAGIGGLAWWAGSAATYRALK